MDEAIGRLTDNLDRGDADSRRAAAEQLAQLGPDAAPAAVALVRACDDDESVREWAVAALEGMEAPPASDVERLAELLADANALSAYWAATLLGRLGDKAAPAVSALAAALDAGRDLSVRERAAWALGQIGPAAAAALSALKLAAASGEARLARLAEQAIARQ